MPSVNPLSDWRRRFAGVVAGGAILCGAAALLALRPPPGTAWQAQEIFQPGSKPVAASSETSIDRAVFEKSLWMPLSKPGSADLAAAAIPKPKELPLEVDLIGISDVNGALVAALYDRRADRLALAKSGDSFAGAQVADVTHDQVTLQRGSEQKVLVRRRPGS